MARYDVFNGDADGLCSLQQLHLSEPDSDAASLVTGTKREIALLQRVPAEQADRVTVLDLSLDKNRRPLLELLESGARVRYFDHHYAGEIPTHANLDPHIDPTANRGTSLLVDKFLYHLPLYRQHQRLADAFQPRQPPLEEAHNR